MKDFKDFYDLWELAQRFDFDGSTLKAAIKATFDRRRTEFPLAMPLSLTPEFYAAPPKQAQWTAFLRKSGLAGAGSLDDIVTFLRTFLLPIIVSIQKAESFDRRWTTGGPWRHK